MRIPYNTKQVGFAAMLLLLISPALPAADPVWNGYQRQGAGPPPVDTALQAILPDTCFYLLRTGFLLEGTATNEGKTYAVKTDFGTVHVPVTNVEYVGRDKQDVYLYKRNSVDGANCNDLMKFAEWCLNIGLKQEGIAEYERALKIAPNPILAEVIRERLKATAEGETSPPDTINPTLSGSAAPARNKNESEANRWAAGVPKPVLDQYVKKVQPVLLAGCAAADCHGTNSSNRFKIAKPRQSIGTTTYGNLQAVLPWIDLDYPTDSPLLAALVTYHGGAKPQYSVESKQYDNVIQWIQTAAKELPIEYHQRLREKNREPEKIAKIPEEVEELGVPLLPQGTTLLPPGFHEIIASGKAPTDSGIVQTQGSVEKKPVEDPLDPAVFNARYHGTKLK